MNQSAMAGRSTKAFDADATLVVVVETSRSVWLVAGDRATPTEEHYPFQREQDKQRFMEGLRRAGVREA